MKLSDEERFELKVAKIEGWLEIYDALYADLVSRREETSSVPGWDSDPHTRTCECRPQWQRGRLCLACENTGWRRCAPGEKGIDPYSAQVPKRASVLLVESDSSRKAHASATLDAQITVLERNANIRAGLEIPEDAVARMLRLVGHKHRTLVKILDALKQLLAVAPDALKSSRRGLSRALAHLVSGRLYSPPRSNPPSDRPPFHGQSVHHGG